MLRDAAEAAIPKALEASRAEDEEAVEMLCRRGMSFATASRERPCRASSGVRAGLRAVDERSGNPLVHRRDREHQAEDAAPAEAPSCASVQGGPASAGIPEGIYETTVTRADYARWGVEVENTGVFTLEFKDGRVISRAPSGGVGFDAPYTLFRDKFEAVGDPDTITARWTFDGRSLSSRTSPLCTGSPCVSTGEFNYHVVMASHPWVLRGAKRPRSTAPTRRRSAETTGSRRAWTEMTTSVFTLEFTDGMVILREPSGEVGFRGDLHPLPATSSRPWATRHAPRGGRSTERG